MSGDQVTTLVTAVTTALSGLGGVALGGWITQRSARTTRQVEEVERARVAVLRLASLLVVERPVEESVSKVAEEAAVAAMTLGYGSTTALAILETVDSWGRFEPGSFPVKRAREELLPLLDQMLERSLPGHLRPKDYAAITELTAAVRRPD